MTNKKMEQKLASALEKTAPDDVCGVLSRCEVRKGTAINMTTKKPAKKIWPTLVAACLAVILLGGGGLFYQQANAVASVVSLDVNPSIELKLSRSESAHTAYRTKILFETNQLLQKEQDENAVITATAGQLMKLLKKDIVVYLSDGKELATPNVFRAVNSIQEDLISENEKAVADWVFRNNKHAGATTDTLSSAKCLYLAIRVNQHVYGVAGIAVNGIPLDSFENSVLLSILGECALALENIKNAKEKEEAAVLAQNEQLRANLLWAISHDLRTPLTAISGSADNLLANYKKWTMHYGSRPLPIFMTIPCG